MGSYGICPVPASARPEVSSFVKDEARRSLPGLPLADMDGRCHYVVKQR